MPAISQCFLGGDIGSSKTHVLIANEQGDVLGFGEAGAGNHEVVGYEGLIAAVSAALELALQSAGIALGQIAGAGFGVSGYDWPSEKEPTLQALRQTGLIAPTGVVNDASLGVLAGSREGWGLAVVSGTGCNCRGLNRDHSREGMVTGSGLRMGEAAGGTELVLQAVIAIAHAWSRRGPQTSLSEAFVRYMGMASVEQLLEEFTAERVWIPAAAAPLVFEAAESGDTVARRLVHWAGCELGEMANAVIRQLEIEHETFDVVLIGSMFKGGPMLIEPMAATIHSLAPGAQLIPLTAAPVVGAVLLGMEQAGVAHPPVVRERLIASFQGLRA